MKCICKGSETFINKKTSINKFAGKNKSVSVFLQKKTLYTDCIQ